jgi:hypothetical protein
MLTQFCLRGRVVLVLAFFAVIGVTAVWGKTTQVVRNVTTNAQGRYPRFPSRVSRTASKRAFQLWPAVNASPT